MLKQNEGSLDRTIRIIIGIMILVAGFFSLTGLGQTITIVIGAIALITGILGFCGFYTLLGISTCPIKKS
ncbi:hypothetical protein COV53_03720 [Candidatus Gottesmanbacteria bacterium CG11_big_fil_rev_8_21_14_0_20_37_11]|uniref:DUF2892 domain-containing protein n=3 Tax=Candidatus Gottesmaniibacteriota TaxID=1752720 RepID=A0A2M7RRR4_9BACT|nr:MAG: hypothetical protein AUJ73_00945 [Candidatus Gottesmanbacteria bacterium CG1_02_37_22]PIP32893.1 MAG: hypothetical protein COX23_02315 [Candidatus Gottesmanbacteria bacterium CG23_combo_of_CG06-09_8_20_14_all_37_19]PIR08328.1 MAG: hypothetical protein COV53_03720 [Candidatus Gottesmanbacteria bacterium CG11_big_fil_rev_8_21_14_0_20_37_11]PIZ03008.1 MAG: DUF2892 domain-containing protein [Candidatus Gottesmanbacteria bacterium CG_4_10_14_0_8_um_filter_37_24]